MPIPPDLPTSIVKPGTLIVVGVSGGPDSMALLHYLHGLQYPILVASFNHNLRPESDDDINFVREVSASLGLPFISGSGDVGAYASAQGLSTEEAARELRYKFLFGEAQKARAGAVAVGHTSDDQAETVLMHFLRGAGLAGLKGMPALVFLPVFSETIPLVRPLLSWTRAETEAYCLAHDVQARIDSTNADTQYFRNRLRHELIPTLEQYNPKITQTLAKTALTLQGDHDLLMRLIDDAWTNVVTLIGKDFVEFNKVGLEKLEPALIRHIFRRAAFQLKPGLRDVDFEALERAVSLRPVDLAGGLKTTLELNRLYLTADEESLPTDAWPLVKEAFSLESGSFELENGWRVDCTADGGKNILSEALSNTDPFSAWLDASAGRAGLYVRNYRQGDRFEPLGMPLVTVGRVCCRRFSGSQ